MGSTQDVVAIFVAEFQTIHGNTIEWSLVADESISLDNIEYNTLPSGVHTIDKDIIYFTKDSYQGVAAYRRIATDEAGMRGARMISVGVLVANSTRPRPWNHISALKRFAVHLEDKPKDKAPLEEYFKEHKVVDLSPPVEEPWNGWEEELSKATMDHPAFHLSHVLHIMGISTLTLFKHSLGRRRILIHAHPPVESACLLAQLAAVISTGEEGSAGVHAHKISVLGVVGLTDIPRINQENSRGNGWIACTTDAIFLEKPQLFDLLIDLTKPAQGRPHRPSLSVSRQVRVNDKFVQKLQTVRFTWSDVKLWTELEGILEADADGCQHDHSTSVAKSRWMDPWRIYEDICMVCAGIWVGWKPATPIKLVDQGSTNGDSSPASEGADTSADSGTQLLPSNGVKKSRHSSIDPRIGPLSTPPSTRARVVTLALLSAFHNHTDFLLSRLAQLLPETPSVALGNGTETSNEVIVLSPKDVMAFELGPGSDLDARFIEWLGETRGRKLKVKRGWKDLLGFVFGFP